MTGRTHQLSLVLAAVFLAFLGQMTLNPIIAPLSREVGLAEWQVGVTISVAALMVVTTSQLWGRRSQSWGSRPVLIAAMGLAATAMALFALVAYLGITGVLAGAWLFALFVLLRGVAFGTAIAAVPPTAQAYIADVTTDETQRVKGMAGIGAVQGVAITAGAVVGGLLAGFGLMVPLVAVPVLLAGGLLLVVLRLRRETGADLVVNPPRISPRDDRVWPYLVAGFGMFTALGFIQFVTGFVVQDRFGLDAETTGLVTGAALLASGVGLIAAQVVLVPRSGWQPGTLLRVGGVVATLGFLALVPDLGIATLVVAMLLVGLGLGIGMPGYTAGPTLLMTREEQGGLAGLIGANNGLTFVVAPTAGTSLYSLWAPLPLVISAVVMATVTAFVLIHPRFARTRAPILVEPVPDPR